MNSGIMRNGVYGEATSELHEIERASELVHQLTHLDISTPETTLDWIYRFSRASSSFNTRTGYNIVENYFISKGLLGRRDIQIDIYSNKEAYALYILEEFMKDVKNLNPISFKIQSHILLWKSLFKLDTSYKVFNAVVENKDQDIVELISSAVDFSRTEKIDTYVIFQGIPLKIDYIANDLRNKEEMIRHTADILKVLI